MMLGSYIHRWKHSSALRLATIDIKCFIYNIESSHYLSEDGTVAIKRLNICRLIPYQDKYESLCEVFRSLLKQLYCRLSIACS